MGYDTRFSGHMTTTPPVSVKQMTEINDYSEAKNIDFEIDKNGNLRHTGVEKTYDYVQGIQTISRMLLKMGCKLNGTIVWNGEENSDMGKIIATDGVITTKQPTINWE